MFPIRGDTSNPRVHDQWYGVRPLTDRRSVGHAKGAMPPSGSTSPLTVPAPTDEPDLAVALPRPVRGVNAFETTVEHLATAIRLGVFTDGDRLPPDRELAAAMCVSRATLREAIAALR